MERKIIDRSPFETIDKPGVGGSSASPPGSAARPSRSSSSASAASTAAIPESIEFFHMAGLDYVSCSPYRVPIARVAAARAAIEHAE